MSETSLNCSNRPIRVQSTFESSHALAVVLDEQKKAGMVSSIKSLPDPNDLEEFVLTKAEKLCHFGSLVGNDEIHQVIDQRIPKNTQN